ncbi:MAG TPA: Calx-beta domain-containing protein [Planctomycetota bacterium]
MKRALGFVAAAIVLPACGHTDHEVVVTPPPAFGTLQFLAAAVQIDEDDAAGFVTLTVTRTGGTSGDVTVDWATATGSAGAADFTGASSTLTWLAGDATPKTFTVNIATDAAAEGSEFFSVTLTNATGGAALGVITTADVEILDTTDLPVSGSLQFMASTIPTAEGTTVNVIVTRTGGSTGAISVEVDSPGGTAAAPGDYTNPGFPVTLTWAAGDIAAKSVDILIVDDAPGGDANVETIQLALQNPLNTSGGPAPILGTTQATTVEITDGDAGGSVEFTSLTYSIGENGTTGVLKVTRTGGTLGAASVQVSVTGGTAAPGDFTFTSPTLVSWADGVGGDVDVNVAVVDDPDMLGDVTVTFGLAAPTGAALGGVVSTTLTITDDETIPTAGEIAITLVSTTVAEGGGPITLTLTRQNGSLNAVEVTITTTDLTATSSGNPAAKQDYVAVNQVVHWNNGEGGVKLVQITIVNNDGTVGQTGDTNLGTEQFRINGSVTLGTATISTSLPIDITIQDD